MSVKNKTVEEYVNILIFLSVKYFVEYLKPRYSGQLNLSKKKTVIFFVVTATVS